MCSCTSTIHIRIKFRMQPAVGCECGSVGWDGSRVCMRFNGDEQSEQQQRLIGFFIHTILINGLFSILLTFCCMYYIIFIIMAETAGFGAIIVEIKINFYYMVSSK
jgi:hypothetical protein